MPERRGHVDHGGGGDAEPGRQRVPFASDQRVVGVHHPFRLAGGARREDQQGDVVRIGAQFGECGRVAALLPTGWRGILPGQGVRFCLAVDDQDVLQLRPVRAELGDHAGVIEVAELAGDRDELQLGQPRP